jgi:SNF2 family DNA or RNA helicase
LSTITIDADHCMAALPWGVIIMDESHNLRTTNSRGADSPHTEAAVAAGAAAGRLILLSGTPSLSRPYDLFRQVDVLVPGLLGRSKEEFAHR